ncbi:TetR/AcrR family transcriptional regulator [Flagellimonas amoyensis]|uniref:TetR/AcrR family transcriptional regulator n=1 Tax=Flagellimonas amoyensis TaxID=2169401 RepID=UPI00131EF55B|nr:TetR/AcrR family transcriptional regulator [Allomuricauda amoyensis]
METAIKLFAESGVNTVKVDDICGQLSISKKTFYKYFQSKEGLTRHLSDKLLTSTLSKLQGTVGNNMNIKEEASQIFDILNQFFHHYSISFFNDIKTHYPEIFEDFVNVKGEIIKEVMEENIKKGISLGFYNKTLNPNMVAQWWFEVIWLAYVLKHPPGLVKELFINGLVKQ